MESWDVASRPTDYILVTIRITIRIRETVLDHDPDPGRTVTIIILLCWRSAEVCALWVLVVYFLYYFIYIQLDCGVKGATYSSQITR